MLKYPPFSAGRRRLFTAGFTLLFPKLINGESKNQNWTTQDAILDTILPKDSFPGALDLGYSRKLSELRKSDNRFQHRFSALLDSIENIAKLEYHRSFKALDIDHRELVLNNFLYDQSSKDGHQTLSTVRQMILGWYYGSETGHNSLGYIPPYRYTSYPD